MKEQLKNVFSSHNILLSEEQAESFEVYFNLLLEWNQKFNLTAITEENEVIVKHFLDSVLMVNEIPQNASVVDVGSGAGFPGIPLKIFRNDIKLVMVDSLQKRVGFLNEVIFMLNLKNTSAVHSRGEDFAVGNREKFDVCVSRAVARLTTLCEICLPLVKVGGVFVPSKSSECVLELEEAKNAIAVLGAKHENTLEIRVPENDSFRCFPVIRKIRTTPAKYPRGKNQPKDNPLL